MEIECRGLELKCLFTHLDSTRSAHGGAGDDGPGRLGGVPGVGDGGVERRRPLAVELRLQVDEAPLQLTVHLVQVAAAGRRNGPGNSLAAAVEGANHLGPHRGVELLHGGVRAGELWRKGRMVV